MRPWLVLLPVFIVATLPACRREEPRPRAAFNVLLLSLDTVRQDVLGCYGHRPLHAPELSTTPVLDRLAHEGVRMVDAYSLSSWTLPSHISMMTGLPPLVHGVEDESGVLAADVPTLAEILRDHGYRTAGVYSAPYLDPHWGFGRGFETYAAVYGEHAAANAERAAAIRAEIAAAAAAADWSRYDALKGRQMEIEHDLNDDSERIVSSEQVTAATVAKIDEFTHQPRPWFLFAHFFDAHCDYTPPAPYDTRFDPDYTGSFSGANCMGGPEVGTPDPDRPGALIRRLGQRDLEHAFALYEGEVAWVDAHVGQVLAALERTGAADRTLVVVTSDHGEEFFEHDGLGHRRTLYEEVVRVPMLLRLPGVLPVDAAVRGPVRLADLVPTILDVLQLPDQARPGSTSFLPLARGAAEGRNTQLYRTVIMFGGEVQVDGKDRVPLRTIVVQDAFRRGPIKILRRRMWPQFQAGLAPELAAILNRAAADNYAAEDLRWIDVERFPTEPRDRMSTDFSDPAAREALAAFQKEYATQLAQRSAHRAESPLPQNVRQRLESLGYIERNSGPAFPEPDTVLPVPGATGGASQPAAAPR